MRMHILTFAFPYFTKTTQAYIITINTLFMPQSNEYLMLYEKQFGRMGFRNHGLKQQLGFEILRNHLMTSEMLSLLSYTTKMMSEG